MVQYSRIFGVNRAPSMPLDKLRFPDANNPPKHIVVMHNNHVSIFFPSFLPLLAEAITILFIN